MEDYDRLLKRLLVIEAWGVRLMIGGRKASPYKIANTLVRETGEYMADFVYNDSGNLAEVNYNRVDRS